MLAFTLNRQTRTVDKAIKYEKEIQPILDENAELKEKCKAMGNTYNIKLQEEIDKIKYKYEEKISHLENENNFLRKVINTLKKTIDKFIHWICFKFSVSEEDALIRIFEFESNTYIEPEKQIEYEEELKQDYEEMKW